MSSFHVGALFGMLDTETDTRLRSDIHDTLNSMLQTLASHNLTHWLGLCRDVLSASKSSKGGKGGDVQNRGEEEGWIIIFKVKCLLHPFNTTSQQMYIINYYFVFTIIDRTLCML